MHYQQWLADQKETASPSCTLSAPEYLPRLRGQRERFLITRLCDITGLDRLGIPVVQAVRPLSLSNSVSQGKGFELEQAAVAATMESIETAVAERIPETGLITCTPADMCGAEALHLLAPLLHEDIDWDEWHHSPVDWIAGLDLASGALAYVPSATVFTDYTVGAPHSASPFIRNTTGLGAGASPEQALRQGLTESLEQLATGEAGSVHGFFEKFRLDLDQCASARTLSAVRYMEKAGYHCASYLCPSRSDVFTVWTRVIEAADTPLGLLWPADGFACRLSLGDAIESSLLEAVQTRCSVIAGSRDDITRAYYPRRIDRELRAFEAERIRHGSLLKTPIGGMTGTQDAAHWLARLLHAFQEQDRRPVLVPLLAEPEVPLFVVRIVAFGLPS